MDVAKKKRSQALSNFTRSNNRLIAMLDDDAPVNLVTPLYSKLESCWETLEKAQDAFIEVADGIDVDTDPQGCSYLNEPEGTHTTTLKRYSSFIKDQAKKEQLTAEKREDQERLLEEERKKKEDAAATELKKQGEQRFKGVESNFAVMVESFKRLTANFTESLDDTSEEVRSAEWYKIEAEFGGLKEKLSDAIKMDLNQDASGMNDVFSRAEKVFLDAQKGVLPKLTPLTSGGGSSRPVQHSAKKEPVELPYFKGNEKMSPFLEYPVWRKQWRNLIGDYDDKYKSSMLCKHVDEYARAKFVGYETDYEEAIKRLDKYFGDSLKVVRCVMRLVTSHNEIEEGAYSQLLEYSSILESNFNRLKSLSLEHEMSNTAAMSGILNKFPRLTVEKWSDFLSLKPSEEKIRPFPIFIDWLNSQKESWERMSASEESSRSSEGSYFGAGNLGGSGSDSGKDKRTCHGCGEVGHIKRFCKGSPRHKSKEPDKKIRKPPVVKKFWCALHQGEPFKVCFSNSCHALRQMEASKRIKLLKDNKDCVHCCGDHKPADCDKKERVCGGDKKGKGRGCDKSHNVHELFCLEAKVFSVVSMGVDVDSGGVMLLIMQVKFRKNLMASVFWDLGCTSNFVREEFAKSCGFKGRREFLNVTTLGGVTTDMSVINYSCSMPDRNGKVEKFEAYGMETITGVLTKLNLFKLRKLFPRLSEKELQSLQRLDKVDILVGMPHPSWHPERAEQSKGGGDFWWYRGKFGVCVGGRLPGIQEGTKKSQTLFSVNSSYHIVSSPLSSIPQSHELEFCENRVQGYKTKFSTSNVLSGSEVVVDLDVRDSLSVVDIPVENSGAVIVPDEHSVANVGSEVSDDLIVEDPQVSEDQDSQGSLAFVDPVSANSLDVVRLEIESPLLSGNDTGVLSVDLDKAGISGFPDVSGESNSRVFPSSSTIPVVSDALLDFEGSGFLPSDLNIIPASNLNVGAKPWFPEEFRAGESSVASGLGTACFGVKTSLIWNGSNLFVESESLGTVVEPRCGGCKCGKCPVPGSIFSFKEQREFDVINKNLFRVAGVNAWYTEYPWRCPRSVLPKNDRLAFQNLLNLERMLEKIPDLADDFCEQIEDMVRRGVAILLSEEDIQCWNDKNGDYFYLPMVGVKGKKWLRVCFDAARKQGGSPCLNDCLLKGPDRFLNNLLSVILGFRNGRVAAAADISKFHNKIRLIEKDIHMQRFLWRKMQKDVAPSTYAVVVNNFGVKPANCIATCALHQSAEAFVEKYPLESEELKRQTYVDDELVAAADRESILLKTQRMDEITAHAGMPNKGWTFSGDADCAGVSIGGESELDEKVLGLLWTPSSDVFSFQVVLKFKLGSKEVAVSSVEEFDSILPSIELSRRIVLSNVSRIFDPVGLLCPIILESKLLMRASWGGSVAGWDDPIPEELAGRWKIFLRSLFKLAGVKFPRSIWPEEEVVGLPCLIIFSDGSASAFGAAAYIRWRLKRGGFWTRLIMAKCKIAPKGVVPIPRMELNGAVVGNRIRNFLLKETNLEFERVYQFVDSSTVLGYVQKESGHFKPYEGVRIAEIQSSNVLKDGKLLGWAWVSTSDNPSDWCTKPRVAEDLVSGGFWEQGPEFLQKEESMWPIKYTYKKDNLEGELQISRVFSVQVKEEVLHLLISRGSSWKRIVRVLARILKVCRGNLVSGFLKTEEIREAKWKLVRCVQQSLEVQLKEAVEKGTGKFRKLAPVLDEDQVWRVGSRLRNFVPFTFDSRLPAIVPPDSKLTLLIMEDAHRFAHSGQDGTLSRFRSRGFWTIRAGHLAKKVKGSCIPCRKADGEKLSQPMGEIPGVRLKDPVAWGWCQMDLFGPFHCRGDVNPRTTKKTWGVILEDVNSGAVHLDIVQDYSSQAVLLTMRRFGALRGWPGKICTDPGSQLESASGKLESWWSRMEGPLREFSTSKNFEWKVSPPDSPWRQGKAERRIGIIKRILKVSVGDSRVTPVELQTILMEIGNICNERPIGLSKPREDGSYDLITPNHLLLGRSSSILPDDAEIATSLPMSARYRLVHHVTTAFWKKWCLIASPSLIVRQKWHQHSRNLCVGDLVSICDSSPLKAKYKLGVVEEVHPSTDGCVRSVTVRYVSVQKNARGEDSTRNIYVKRSIQRLILILPVEEQSTNLVVEDHESSCMVKAGV